MKINFKTEKGKKIYKIASIIFSVAIVIGVAIMLFFVFQTVVSSGKPPSYEIKEGKLTISNSFGTTIELTGATVTMDGYRCKKANPQKQWICK